MFKFFTKLENKCFHDNGDLIFILYDTTILISIKNTDKYYKYWFINNKCEKIYQLLIKSTYNSEDESNNVKLVENKLIYTYDNGQLIFELDPNIKSQDDIKKYIKSEINDALNKYHDEFKSSITPEEQNDINSTIYNTVMNYEYKTLVSELEKLFISEKNMNIYVYEKYIKLDTKGTFYVYNCLKYEKAINEFEIIKNAYRNKKYDIIKSTKNDKIKFVIFNNNKKLKVYNFYKI